MQFNFNSELSNKIALVTSGTKRHRKGKLPFYESILPYAAAKAGLINYSKGRSKEVAPKGGRGLPVSPGWIMTDGPKRMMERIANSETISIEQATQRMCFL